MVTNEKTIAFRVLLHPAGSLWIIVDRGWECVGWEALSLEIRDWGLNLARSAQHVLAPSHGQQCSRVSWWVWPLCRPSCPLRVRVEGRGMASCAVIGGRFAAVPVAAAPAVHATWVGCWSGLPVAERTGLCILCCR